jgi:hypothetical protein
MTQPSKRQVMRGTDTLIKAYNDRVARQSDSIATFVKFLETYQPDMSQNAPLLDQFNSWAEQPGNRVHTATKALGR